jgi:Ser/Thr protein kinase RdoA (MazF antagonist)
MQANVELARRIALGCYGLEPRVEPLTRQNHAVFRLRFEQSTKVLKIAKDGDASSLRKELAILEFLREHGLPVPEVEHADAAGAYLGYAFVIMHSAGDRRVSDAISGPEETARRLFFEMGTLLARIHDVRPSVSGELGPRDGPAQRAEADELANWAADRGYLGRDAARRFHGRTMLALDGVALCHGDFHAVQCVADAERITAVVDWETAWIGNPDIDLAMTHAYLDFYCPFGLIDRFFAGYISVRPLAPEYDELSLPVRMAQALAMLRVWDQAGLEPNLLRTIELYRAYDERAG